MPSAPGAAGDRARRDGGDGGHSPKAVQALRNLHGIPLPVRTRCRFSRGGSCAPPGLSRGLLPPFFKALTHHAERSAYSWHTPGHAGGVGSLKSPAGLRACTSSSARTRCARTCRSRCRTRFAARPHRAGEGGGRLCAASVFGADHTYFVTNGTSTANKIVWHFDGRARRPGDRRPQLPQGLLHSLIMTGATPIYFTPSRNDYGIIGPIGLDQFSPAAIRKKIEASRSPAATGHRAHRGGDQLPTYDGLCYNAEKIKAVVADQVDALHFDEAWYAYAAFHEFYAGRHAMGVPARPSARRPHARVRDAVDAQAARRVLAGVDDPHPGSDKRKIDTTRFSDAFMMHGSTSPHYGIIASLDVSSAMMEGTSSRAIVQETHDGRCTSAARSPRSATASEERLVVPRLAARRARPQPRHRPRPTGCSTRRPTGTASASSPTTT